MVAPAAVVVLLQLFLIQATKAAELASGAKAAPVAARTALQAVVIPFLQLLLLLPHPCLQQVVVIGEAYLLLLLRLNRQQIVASPARLLLLRLDLIFR